MELERVKPGRYMTMDCGGVYFEPFRLIEVFDLVNGTTMWRYLGSCMAFNVCERFPRDKVTAINDGEVSPLPSEEIRTLQELCDNAIARHKIKTHELVLDIDSALTAYQAVRGVDQLLDPVRDRIEKLKSHCIN